jgi:hypothetical protein
MNKIILMILFAVISNAVNAEWLKVDEKDENSNATVYINTDYISVKGSRIKFWELVDFKTRQEDHLGAPGYLSTKSQEENDCREMQYRTHFLIKYSGNMGDGQVIFNENNPNHNWIPIAPDSIGDGIFKIVCKIIK